MKHRLTPLLTGILLCGALTACNPSVADLPPAATDQPWKQSQTDMDSGAMDNRNNSASAETKPSGSAPKFELPSGLSVPYRRDEVSVDASHTYSLPELIDL